ncbi:MAG: hypothetical protein AB1792_11135 [Candidatus Zixiibacteriota bacterium]
MAFTSPELVRAHLDVLRLGETRIDNHGVVLNGTTPVQLPHTGLVEGSLVVKCRRGEAPTRELAVLADAWVSLSHDSLVPDSVVIASDSSLGVVFQENVDFIVDYTAGRVRRIVDGAIGGGQTVVVWFEYHHVFTAGDDYTITYTSGQLARRSTGAIADGQSVLVEYAVANGFVSDAVIEQAMAESGEAVLAMVDSPDEEQPAPALVIGATHWTVAAVARMRAAAALASSAADSAAVRNITQAWLDLADRYEQSGRQFLSRFAAPVPSLQSLRHG